MPPRSRLLPLHLPRHSPQQPLLLAPSHTIAPRTLTFSYRARPNSALTPTPPPLLRTFTTATTKMSAPRPDFKTTEATRPDWDASARFRVTKTADPSWRFGQGPNTTSSSSGGGDPSSPPPPPAAQQQQPPKHVSIDPYEDGRPAAFNYKLLTSGIVPRPIGFVSTQSSKSSSSTTTASSSSTTTSTTTTGPGNGNGNDDGGVTLNLAPMSYFNVIGHDPPLFALGISGPGPSSLDPATGEVKKEEGQQEPARQPKDTLRNLANTRECVVNIISESFVEAANACSVDAPPGASEWDVSGLTPVWPPPSSRVVGAPRVAEAVFSVECVVESIREFPSRSRGDGSTSGCLVVLEGVRFWVREDATNLPDRSEVDPRVLRPMGRLGGISYSRLADAIEIPRPSFERDVGGAEGYDSLVRARAAEAKGGARGSAGGV